MSNRALHVGDEAALLAASAARISISSKKRYIHLDAAYEPKFHH
jgi:tetraacyldisaccharide-1-P 4'-kinase